MLDVAEITETDGVVPVDGSERKRLRCHNWAERQMKKDLCAHPTLEIYREGQIQFMVPLARQGDFYVPEIRRVERRLSEQEESHSDTDISGTRTSCCHLLYVLIDLQVQTRTVNTAQGAGFSCQTAESRPRRRHRTALRLSRINGDRDYRRRDSRGTSFRELDWEQPGGQQAEREEWFHGDSNQKSLEAPTQERWWGVAGGEDTSEIEDMIMGSGQPAVVISQGER
ncbi:Testis-expressed protein 264 [Collichthys lucidus]|uniref:Testis-expressed protein 264 n=1 Tax=Collichthys lucidus TaxID=240159 RepID=A0A4V6AP26_COLLU|nr:Testis-expressed protein 264 [Collichthys lucidus]